MKRITTAAAALALMSAALAAEAAPITIDFSVLSDNLSHPSYGVGVMGTGYFTYDDSLKPASGNGVVGNVVSGLATLDLSFNWFGVAFDESTASIGTLTFAGGLLTNWLVGGSFLPPLCGFSRYSCVHSGGSQPDFYVTSTGGGALADAVRPGLASVGTVQWSVRSATVPEPAALGLIAAALAGLGLARRRRGAVLRH